MLFAEKQSDDFYARKAKRTVLRRLMHSLRAAFSKAKEINCLGKSGNDMDLSTDKIIFTGKRNDYFYTRKAKRTLKSCFVNISVVSGALFRSMKSVIYVGRLPMCGSLVSRIKTRVNDTTVKFKRQNEDR